MAAESRARPKRIARTKHVTSPISIAKTLVGDRERTVPIYDRETIGAGARIRGPLVVVELSSTAYVAPEFILRVDDFGNLHLEMAR
jgi:5-oxoprolinase (ATP-hydrolysing)